jgi:hypothetical protein
MPFIGYRGLLRIRQVERKFPLDERSCPYCEGTGKVDW